MLAKRKATAEISVGSLEVVSEESFLKRLEGMASCEDCQLERRKSSSKSKRHGKNQKKNNCRQSSSKARTNSPIVIKLSDSLKATMNRRRGSRGWKAEVDEDGGEIEAEESSNEMRFRNFSRKGGHGRGGGSRGLPQRRYRKNFHSMISAIQKAHTKDISHGDVLNYNNLHPHNEHSLLLNNNRIQYLSHSLYPFPRNNVFVTCNDNVDLICNDLHDTKSDSIQTISDSDGQALFTGSDSTSSNRRFKNSEMNHLVKYTTGCSLTRCSQFGCLECMSSQHMWPHSVIPFRKPDFAVADGEGVVKADGDDDDDESETESDTTTEQSTSSPPSSPLLVSSQSSSFDSDEILSSETSSISSDCVAQKPVTSHVGGGSSARSSQEVTDECSDQCQVEAAKNTDSKTADVLPCKPTISKLNQTKTSGDAIVKSATKNRRHCKSKNSRSRRSGKPCKNDGSQIFTITSKQASCDSAQDSIYIDLTGVDVELTVFYHAKPAAQDWCYNYASNPSNYYYYSPTVPYMYYPPMYMPSQNVVTVPRPLCVPRDQDILTSAKTCMIPAHDIEIFTASQPSQRPWVPLQHPDRSRTAAVYTVMCYNVLCDKYCTRQQYGYCPSWALAWEYRKKFIIEEIRHYSADIISLQEVETDQFYNFFLPELKHDGYDGIFSPKSRARTMSESERKHVDGCAIFFRTNKFSLVKEHLMEFNQLAMQSAEGSHGMINRVTTKDNIGLAAILETKAGVFDHGPPAENLVKQPLLVVTAHVHWDPEYSDVKLIQTMMLLSEMKNFIEEHQKSSSGPSASNVDLNSIPLVLCGDLNSLPDSGVLEYLLNGKISASHEDFKDMGYDDCLQKLNSLDSREQFGHDFRLGKAYSDDIMQYTNYTYDFKGIIDYIVFSRDFMSPLGVLGPIEPEWFTENKVIGCPHPHIPSDHFALMVEFEMPVPYPTQQQQQQQQQRTSVHSFARR